MRNSKNRFQHIYLALIGLLVSFSAHADYTQRLEFGAGVLFNSSQAQFEIGAEYEYRLEPMWGLGAFGNYQFSSPGVMTVGAPEVFFHPFETEFYLSAAPIAEFGSGIDTEYGVRLETRLPIPLGAIDLIPTFAVELINGGPYYMIGLGIRI